MNFAFGKAKTPAQSSAPVPCEIANRGKIERLMAFARASNKGGFLNEEMFSKTLAAVWEINPKKATVNTYTEVAEVARATNRERSAEFKHSAPIALALGIYLGAISSIFAIGVAVHKDPKMAALSGLVAAVLLVPVVGYVADAYKRIKAITNKGVEKVAKILSPEPEKVSI